MPLAEPMGKICKNKESSKMFLKFVEVGLFQMAMLFTFYCISSLGLSFQDFYQQCREAFLVNSDLTLRAQLTEFKDHKLIRTKKVYLFVF